MVPKKLKLEINKSSEKLIIVKLVKNDSVLATQRTSAGKNEQLLILKIFFSLNLRSLHTPS